MVAQPESRPRTAAPSATTMTSKREVPDGADTGRSASVKSTRISDAEVETIPPVGDFAALAATPATSVAPAPEAAVVVPKRSRGGARSVPPSLTAPVDSPSRRAGGQPRSRSPHEPPSPEIRQLISELAKEVKKGHEEKARDRARITRLERDLESAFKDSVVYTDKSMNSLRTELSQFGARR